MNTLIFANGDLELGDWILPYFQHADQIIGVDGGTQHLYTLNRLPTHIVGDFDSLENDILGWAKLNSVNLFQFPTDKDETDLELALKLGLGLSNKPILIFGVFGGRLDQLLANVQLLAYPEAIGRSVTLISKHERTFLIDGKATIQGNVGDIVSLLPFAGDVVVKQTSGLKWQLENSTLKMGFARGVSNVLNESRAQVEVENGRLLCVHQYRPTNR